MGTRWIRWTMALGALLALHGADRAQAHGPLGVLQDAVRVADGLYEVPLRTGPPIYTHGADGGQALAADPSAGNQRPPLCTAGAHQVVLYGRPVTAPDASAAARPLIEAAIFNMNAELDRAAMESGGLHADYRVKCDANGDLHIGTFVNAGTASFRDVVDAARLAGALDDEADYAIFYDDPSPKACGIGSFVADDAPGAGNENNAGGGYALVYRDCWDGLTVMHEVGHTMGAVQAGAPNATGVHGHCRDEADVMCYADGAEGATGMLDRCPGGERFDCGYDDYFDAAPEPGEYLAGHWNLGSEANRFIELTQPLPGEVPAALSCVRSTGEMLLAVDTIGCAADTAPEDEPVVADEPEDPAVRIVRVAYHPVAGRVQARIECPPARSGDCRGRLSLSRRPSRATGGRSFRLQPGASASVRIPLVPAARRAWERGRLRRVWVVARVTDASADAARVVPMARPGSPPALRSRRSGG